MKWFLIGTIVSVVNGSSAQIADYQHSGDFSSHVLYVTTNITLSKRISETALGQVLVTYTVAKSHREGIPELALDSGNRVDNFISLTPKRLGISENGRWMAIEDRDFDEAKGGFETRWYVVDLPNARWHQGPELESVITSAKLPKQQVTSIKTESVDLFFEKMLVSYFEKRVKRVNFPRQP